MNKKTITKAVAMFAAAITATSATLPANAGLLYEPSNYAARENLLLQLDGIRNVGLLKAHDGNAAQWIDLAAGNRVSFGNKTGSGVVSEWADDGYVFGGGEIGRLADAINPGSAFTIQLVFDADKSTQTANYPFFFDCGSDNCGFYTYKVDTNNQLIFRVKAVSGVSDVSIKPWTGRHYYATALYDKGVSSVFETETGTVTAGSTTTSVGYRAFTIGGRWLGTASDNDRYLNGTIKAVRIYNKVLSAEELSQNRALDDARFFNGIPVTNVVIATAVAGLEGNEETGAYAFDAEGYTFSAPQKATLNGNNYICAGYTLETWDGAAWSAPVRNDGARAVAFTDTSAKVRLTWQWQEDDAPAPTGDAYIESDGSTFVNTGVMPATDLRIEVDYAFTTVEKAARLFGVYTGDGRNAAYYVNDDGGLSFHVGQGWVGGQYLVMPDLNRHTVVFDIPAGKVHDITGSVTNKTESMKSTPGLSATGNVPIALFGRMTNANGSTIDTPAKARIYGAKFYKNGKLVKNFIPCVKGGVAGFRDTIDGTFHTGEFNVSGLSAGGDVERIPDDGFIELAGNDQTKADGEKGGHYIDTGYTPGPNTRIEFDYALAANRTGSGDWYLLQAGNSTETVALYQNANAIGACLGTAMWKGVGLPSQANAAFVRRTAIFDSQNKAVTMLTAGYANYANTNDVFVAFSANAATSIKLGSTAGMGGGYTPLRIYGLRIYESGSLVREYVPYVKNGAPGLKYGDTFLRVYWDANNGRNGMPKAGGDIAVSSDRDRDAYVLFAGAQRVDTGYVPNANTKVVVDFGFANGYNKPQQIPFDASSGLYCRLYTQNGGGTDAKYSVIFNKGWTVAHSGIAVDHQRRLVVFDAPNTTMSMTPGATDDSTYSSSSVSASGATSAYSLIFGSLAAPDKDNGYMYAKTRLYRLTIYDGSDKVREYVPVVENGVAGLYDLVNGGSVLTASGLTVSGRGHEGAEEWLITPHDASLSDGDAKTFTARAVGAQRYVWTKDGEEIDGETGESLTVAWTRGDYAEHTYAVASVYDVFGTETIGTAQSFSVNNNPCAFTIIMR
ncbi:MAG: hypothetical protein ILM98_14890 [Kiritimatiellae bacterium]|nr:hypothetical protein [Kiritimatiellia bacterium]